MMKLERTGKETAYLRLPGHPGSLKGGRTIPLTDLLGKRCGPYVVFDIDSKNDIVGIEIVGEDENEEEDEGSLDHSIAGGETRIRLDVSVDDPSVAYLRLPEYPDDGIPKVARTLNLRKMIGQCGGADINLDFDDSGTLVGIEILG